MRKIGGRRRVVYGKNDLTERQRVKAAEALQASGYVPPTRGQASGGKKITVDLVCIHNTGGTEKAKGEGASKYGDPETRMIVWIPNACHDVVTDQTALEGLREGCTRVVLDEQLWREKQAEWKPAEDRDSYAMDEALSKANHEDVPF